MNVICMVKYSEAQAMKKPFVIQKGNPVPLSYSKIIAFFGLMIS